MDLKAAYLTSQTEFKQTTKKSAALYEEAVKYLSKGVTRDAVFYEPYPVTMEKAVGTLLIDADGNEYIDYLNNFGSLIHGHTNAEIIEQVKKDVVSGTAIAAPVKGQTDLAKLLCERIPSMESVRFCNSGLEATLFAIKAARAYSGKTGLITMEGAFHGLHDTVEFIKQDNNDIVPKSAGVLDSISKEIYITPFNDAAAMEALLKENNTNIAAIIVEPVMGAAGMIPPEAGYLEKLRSLADEYNVLLIFDEIQTLRISEGGAQSLYNVTPDITTVAKIIGGGFPVGAFGASKAIMSVFDPASKNHVIHSGTFSGNNVSMNAGVKALEMLNAAEIDRIDSLTNKLIKGMEQAIEENNIKAHITSSGSMFTIHYTDEKPKDFKVAKTSNKEISKYVHLELMKHGINTATRGAWYLSTAMDETHIEKTIIAFSKVMEKLANAIN